MSGRISSVRALFQGISFAFRATWHAEKSLFPIVSAEAAVNVAQSFFRIVFPMLLLDSLTAGRLGATIVAVAGFAVSQLIFGALTAILRRNREMGAERMKIQLNTMLVDKLASLRHEQMENTENLRKYEIAVKCVDQGDASSFLECLFSVLSSAAIIAGVFYVFKDMPWWVLVTVVCVVAVNAVGNTVSARYSYAEMTEETPTERKLYYLRGRLMNQEYAKEIRAFQLKDFISSKTREAIEGFFKISRDYDKKHHKILW